MFVCYERGGGSNSGAKERHRLHFVKVFVRLQIWKLIFFKYILELFQHAIHSRNISMAKIWFRCLKNSTRYVQKIYCFTNNRFPKQNIIKLTLEKMNILVDRWPAVGNAHSASAPNASTHLLCHNGCHANQKSETETETETRTRQVWRWAREQTRIHAYDSSPDQYYLRY